MYKRARATVPEAVQSAALRANPMLNAGVAPAPEASAAQIVLIPLLIVMLPLIALSAVTFVLPVLAPALMQTAGRPAADFGWMGAAMGFGSVAFLVANRAISPVLGPLRTLRFGLAATGVGGLLILTGFWPAMILGTACIGFGFATNTTAGGQILADFTPKAAWGTLFSLCQAAVPIGGAIAVAIAAETMVTSGWAGSLAWCIGIVAVTLAGVALVPRRYNSSRPLETFVPAKLLASFNLANPVRSVRKRPGFPAFVTAGCGLAMGHAVTSQFFVLYLCNVVGLTLADAALLYIVQLVTAIGGRITFGAAADWFGAPAKVLTMLAPASTVASLLIVGFPGHWPIAAQIAVATVIGITAASWNGVYAAEIARRVPAADVSTATADCSVFIFLAYMVTPPLFGVLATTFGWPAAFLTIAAAPLISSVLFVSDRFHPSSNQAIARGAPALRHNHTAALAPRPLAAILVSLVAILGVFQTFGANRPTRPASLLTQPASRVSVPEQLPPPSAIGRKP